LDLICWWLGEKPTLVSFEHDSFGGPEGVAHVHLRHEDCEIDIQLSWLNELSNTYTIKGEAAEINNGIEEWWHIPLTYRSGMHETIKLDQEEEDYMEFGRKVVGNFLDVITKDEKPLVPASEVVSSVELIAECYQAGTRFNLPWYQNLENLIPHQPNEEVERG
jgi:predicted dehydrogenase